VREKLGKAHDGRAGRRTPLLSFFTIADVQLADEESPLRGEWADKCFEHPAKAAFRPHETMVPHLMNAHIRAANAIAEKGSPVLDDAFSFAIGLGDLADNNQLNEIRWIIDLFDGNKLVDPDSGEGEEGDGYDGVQGNDPIGATSTPLETPVEGETILDLANEPFWAPGVRPGGERLPWYSLPGNHDLKVQGTIPNESGWREAADAYAQGSVKWTDVPPDQQNAACAGYSDPNFYLSPNPNAKVVPADPDRHILSREEWVETHFETTGLPVGHGYKDNRCTDENGEPLERACWSFTDGLFHYIGLDSNPHEGLESGNIDDPQFQWLERELTANSKRYFDAEGKEQTNKKGRNKLIVVFSHHTKGSMDNEETEGAHTGADLRKLLVRYPNVIVHANGHTHQNKIWGRKSKKLHSGYWELNTSAIADFPHQSRTVEIADNHDGTLSIFAVVFDALVAPDPREIHWAEDDPTNEVLLAGAERAINEDWFASAAREVGYYDPQADLTKIGTPKDRNVELVIKVPFKLGAGGSRRAHGARRAAHGAF